MNEGEAAVKHAKRRRLSQRTLPPLHTNTTECVNTRTLALNLHNKIPLFKNSAALKRSLEYRISQTKKQKNKKINKTKKNAPVIHRNAKRNRTLKTQQNTEPQIRRPTLLPKSHNTTFRSVGKQAHKQKHKHIKSLKFYTLVLHVFDIEFLSSSSSLTELTWFFFFSPTRIQLGKISLQLYTKVRVNEHNTCDPLTPRMPKKKKKTCVQNLSC